MKLFILFILMLPINTLEKNNKQKDTNIYSELSDLCKVWGMLKYFHPEIARGKKDWDYILTKSLNSLLDLNDSNFENEIDRLLDIAGNNSSPIFIINKTKHPYCYRNIHNNWFRKSKNLNSQQKRKIEYFYSHPFQGTNYYAQNNVKDDGNVITPNEKKYLGMKMPNKNYRLLGLFRFWNFINYYYPYKYLTDKHWDQVLVDLIPKFIRAENPTSYKKVVLEMAASINDAHGGVYPEMLNSLVGDYSPPFYFKLIGNKAIVTKVLDSKNNFHPKKGFIIESIDAVNLNTRIENLAPYIPASNISSKYKNMHQYILNSKNEYATYSGYYYKDKKKTFYKVKLNKRNFLKEYLDFFDMKSEVLSKTINRDISYVFAANLSSENLDSIMKESMNKKAIILDLRNYPQKMPVYKIADYFLKKPSIYCNITKNDFSYPSLFIYETNNKGINYEKVGFYNPKAYQGILVVLVDYRTQSLSEFVCLILKTYEKTIIIGNQTSGADGNVSKMTFLGGYDILFSGFGIYFPDGKETQRVGIPIDIVVNYTINDYLKFKDPVLEKAIKYIEAKIK